MPTFKEWDNDRQFHLRLWQQFPSEYHISYIDRDIHRRHSILVEAIDRDGPVSHFVSHGTTACSRANIAVARLTMVENMNRMVSFSSTAIFVRPWSPFTTVNFHNMCWRICISQILHKTTGQSQFNNAALYLRLRIVCSAQTFDVNLIIYRFH